MSFPGLTKVQAFGIRIPADGDVRLSPGLRSWPVTDARGKRIATIYGMVLRGWTGPGIRVTDEGVSTDFPITGEHDFVRKLLYQLHGMFVAVTAGELGGHLMLDFGGSIPMVWCTGTGAIGSSADQILDDAAYQARFRADLYQKLVAGEGHGWFTGTLTAHRGVRRLLPGHALDLSTLQPRRIWPLEGELAFDLDLESGAAIAGSAIRGLVEAAARETDAAITLTAGFDSRVLLAAARHVTDRIGFATFGDPDEGLDQIMSARMADALGLRHRLIPVVDAPEAERLRWDRMVGHCMREVNRRIHPALAAVPADYVLTGMYGEIGRARLYRQDIDTINDKPATADFVLSRLTLPRDADHVADIAQWVEGIAWMPRSMVLDMAFNELKFGTWAMGQAPAQKACKFSFIPFGQMAVQAAFMRMPPRVKGTEALFTRIVETLWPEAMEFPVNRYGDWRDRFGKLAKLTRRESIVRYLRDRLAR